MTDIVERLDEHDPVDMEAKAEIERLRAQAALQNAEDFYLRTITAPLGAEIGRLREAMRWIAGHSSDPGAVKRAREELG